MKILSIDLDFIMPQLTNFEFLEFDSDKETPLDYWTRFSNTYDVSFECRNNSAYRLVLEIINLLHKHPTKVYLINKHQEILNIIGSNCADIVNLDQHHDIYYSFFDKQHAARGENLELLESSWVYYLYTHNQLNSYTWVTNANASYCKTLLRFPFSFYIEDVNAYQDVYGIELLLEKGFRFNDFDCVVFVRSPYYLPDTNDLERILLDINSLSPIVT